MSNEKIKDYIERYHAMWKLYNTGYLNKDLVFDIMRTLLFEIIAYMTDILEKRDKELTEQNVTDVIAETESMTNEEMEDAKKAIIGFTEFMKGVTGNKDLKIPEYMAKKYGIEQDDILDNLESEGKESCDNCKHNTDSWDSDACDGCCGNHSRFEPQEISREEIAALLARESEDKK